MKPESMEWLIEDHSVHISYSYENTQFAYIYLKESKTPPRRDESVQKSDLHFAKLDNKQKFTLLF